VVEGGKAAAQGLDWYPVVHLSNGFPTVVPTPPQARLLRAGCTAKDGSAAKSNVCLAWLRGYELTLWSISARVGRNKAGRIMPPIQYVQLSVD